jgi:hypothetical protein
VAVPTNRIADYADLELAVLRLPGVAGAFLARLQLDGEPASPWLRLEGEALAAVSRHRSLAARGTALGELLLGASALAEPWRRFAAAAPRRRVRLCLDPTAPELHALPWEAMREPGAAVWLGACAETPVSRFFAGERILGLVIQPRPLRVLVAVANPTDAEAEGRVGLDRAAEEAALATAVADLVRDGEVELSRLEAPVTCTRLVGELARKAPDVLYLVAHGRFGPAGTSVVYLEDEQGQTAALEEAELEVLARGLAYRPRLVYLSSCETARAGGAGTTSLGLAPRLVGAGVPAVIAMREQIGVAAAGAFAASFFRQLCAHGLVDRAVNEARAALLAAGRERDAALPVLCQQLRDGRLFRPRQSDPDNPHRALFVSFHHEDAALAARLRERLAAHGYRTVALDFDPEQGTPAGRAWELELHAALRPCRAVLLLASARCLASRWRWAELAHARQSKRILPLRLEPCHIDPELAQEPPIDLFPDLEAGLATVLQELARLGLGAAKTVDWNAARPPYPGLAALEEADAAVFFGRDPEVGAALDTLHALRRQGGRRWLLLLGASGSGKSSLLRAGLVPALRRDPRCWQVLGPVRPGARSLARLTSAFIEAWGALGRPREAGEARAELAAGGAGVFARWVQELRAAAGQPGAQVVLLLDQLEESLGRSHGVAAEPLFGLLQAVLARVDVPLLVVAALRSDALAAFQAVPQHRGLDFASLSLGPMAPEALAEVILEPAARARLELEPGLVEVLLDDALGDEATGDALPLLAFALRDLYDRGGRDRLLTLAEYRQDQGELPSCLARAAERVLAGLPVGSRELARSAFLALVELDLQGQPTRRMVTQTDLGAAACALLRPFVDARLLVASELDGWPVLEVAHDALLHGWQRLAGWLEEARAALALRRDLELAAAQWQEGGYDPELLSFRGKRLGAACELESELGRPLPERERAFLDASQAAEDAASPRRHLGLSLATLAGAVVGGAALVALWRRRRSN